VWPRQDDPLLQQLLDAWQVQPSFAFAVVADDQQCSVAGCRISNDFLQQNAKAAADTAFTPDGGVPPCSGVHCLRPTALVLCWADREAAVLHLPSINSATEDDVSHRVWAAVTAVFGDTNRTAACCGAASALAALTAVGVQCRLTVDDPCVAFLLWQPRALEQLVDRQLVQQHQHNAQQHVSHDSDVLNAAHLLVLNGSFRLSVPVVEGRLAAAARTTLLTRALMPPLRAILVQHQLWNVYEAVERPLQSMFAGVRVAGMNLLVDSIQSQQRECMQQREVLLQYASRLLHAHDSVDIRVPAHVHLLLTQLHLAPAKQDLQQPLVTVLQHAIRNALQRNHRHQLPLLRCLLSYHMMRVYEDQLHALMGFAITTAGGISSNMVTSIDTNTIDKQVIVFQPLPHVGKVFGGVLAGVPSSLGSLLTHELLPGCPVVVSEGSIADVGVVNLASPTPVVAYMPTSGPAHQALQPAQLAPRWGVLCSIAEPTPVKDAGSMLPLHGGEGGDACTRNGCVRFWCAITHTTQSVDVCTSLLHTVDQQQANTCALLDKATLVPRPISILSTIQPSNELCTFVGVQLQQLQLVVLAALSRDPCFLAALSSRDPLAAAASHWVTCNGLQSSTQHMLCSRIAAGAVDGTPVQSSCVERALFQVAVEALVFGRKPSVVRALLGLEQSVDLANTLLVAFPELAAWRAQLLEDCKRTK
jgi:hypothetical protein